MPTWQLQHAKAKLSEVIQVAAKKGPKLSRNGASKPPWCSPLRTGRGWSINSLRPKRRCSKCFNPDPALRFRCLRAIAA